MQCYYETLKIDSKASESDLKKAYKKLALELHPDRNITTIKESTHNFAIVQHAYEVLSDKNERAWYDAHKNSILNHTQKDNLGLTSVFLMTFFTICFTNFGDDDHSFYVIYGQIFSLIETEELDYVDPNEMNNLNDITSFGGFRDTFDGYIDHGYESPFTLTQFYNKFATFTTKKTFAWHDLYRITDKDDRKTRRLMERDNKRARELGRKEYNDTIRSLCAFVKKRDPRFKMYQDKLKLAIELKSKENLVKLKKVKLARAESGSNYVEQDWTRAQSIGEESIDNSSVSSRYEDVCDDLVSMNIRIDDDKNDIIHLEGNDQDIAEDELFCYACERKFKSVQQLKNHSNSKKHKARLLELRKELEYDDGDNDESRT